MERITVLSRRGIGHPLSGGAARYVHEIFRRLTTHYSVTILSSGWAGSLAEQDIDGITYRHFPGAFHRILLPARYLVKFAQETDLLVDNADVGIPWLSPLYSRIPRITIIHQLVREIFYDELPRPLSNLGYALEPLLYRLYSHSESSPCPKGLPKTYRIVAFRRKITKWSPPAARTLGALETL